jgi:hypothetical protein
LTDVFITFLDESRLEVIFLVMECGTLCTLGSIGQGAYLPVLWVNELPAMAEHPEIMNGEQDG